MFFQYEYEIRKKAKLHSKNAACTDENCVGVDLIKLCQDLPWKLKAQTKSCNNVI